MKTTTTQQAKSCAVLVPRMAAELGTGVPTYRSAERLVHRRNQGFQRAVLWTLDCVTPPRALAIAYRQAIRRAQERRLEWLYVLGPQDIAAEHALDAVGDYLDDFDVILGRAVRWYRPRGADDSVAAPRPGDPLRPADSLLVPISGLLIRTETAVRYLPPQSFERGGDLEWLLRLCGNARTIRLDRPLGFRCWHAKLDDPTSDWRQQRRQDVQYVLARMGAGQEVVSTFEYRGERYRFFIRDPLDQIQKYHLGGHLWEDPVLKELVRSVPTGGTVVDVGAHVGNHAVYLAKALRPSRMVLFEASPATCEHLRANLVLNGLADARVRVQCVGVGSHRHQATLTEPERMNSGATFLQPHPEGSVVVRPLDELLAQLDQLDLLKIDVEGMELEMLAGARRLIQRTRPHLLVEVAPNHEAEFRSQSAALKYRCRWQQRTPTEATLYLTPSEQDST